MGQQPSAGMDGAARAKAAQNDVRARRAYEWKENWCEKNGRFVQKGTRAGERRVPDIAAAPEPDDEALHWPEAMVSVFWETGCLTVTLDAFQKLPAARRSQIMKLGGLK